MFNGENMNGRQHLIATSIMITLLILLMPLDDWLTQKQQIVLFFSMLVFSSLITPDVDLKIPLVPHRGPTHNPTSIVVLFVLVSIVGWFALTYMKLNEYANYIPYFGLGAIVGWLLHVIQDKFFPKHQAFVWLILFLFAVVAFVISK